MHVTLINNEVDRLKAIQDLAVKNIREFRTQARLASKAYTKDDVSFIRQLSTPTYSSYEIVQKWQEELIPKVNENISRRQNKYFNNSLRKHLAVDGEEAAVIIEELLDDRLNVLVDTFVQNYGLSEDVASSILTTTPQQLVALSRRYVDYVLFKEVARDQSITVIDAHEALPQRTVASLVVRRNEKQHDTKSARRIEEIDAQLVEIKSLQNGFIGEIIDAEWNLITIFALRREYEKRLASLDRDDVLDSLKRLEVFDDITKSFKDTYIENISNIFGLNTLESVRKLGESVDTLLMRIFDMPLHEKNQLLGHTKQYRELTEEKKRVMNSARPARLHGLNASVDLK